MFNKFILFLSLISILAVHLIAITFLKEEDKTVVAIKKVSMNNISIRKVVLKKKEKRKVEKKIKKIEKKIVKKANKKAKRKVPKKENKKAVLVEEKLMERSLNMASLNTKKTIKNIKSKIPYDNNIKKIIENKYLFRLREKIEKNKVYPKRAKRLKQEGRVLVSFYISKEGYIQNISIKNASSFKRLNKAAINLLNKIKKFEPIPKELEKHNWVIEVPINYSIINI